MSRRRRRVGVALVGLWLAAGAAATAEEEAAAIVREVKS